MLAALIFGVAILARFSEALALLQVGTVNPPISRMFKINRLIDFIGFWFL
jgi:hypothetical protein